MQTLPILRLSARIISWKPQAPKLRLGVVLTEKKNKNKIKTLLSCRHETASSFSQPLMCLRTHGGSTQPFFPRRQTCSVLHTPSDTHTHTYTITRLLRQTVARAGMSLVRSMSLWGDIHLRLHYRLIQSTNKDSHARQYPLPLAGRATCSAPRRGGGSIRKNM